jgi:cytochrome b
LRLPWGWLGSRHARFAGFVRSPPVTLRYARLVARRAEPRHLGHNPLGGWMILALITAVLAATITGWLYTTDRFWGVEWMANLHGFCADSLIVLATVHVLGVIAASIRHRENLVAAMIHGHKRAPAPGDME